jgi:hypothetical protein
MFTDKPKLITSVRIQCTTTKQSSYAEEMEANLVEGADVSDGPDERDPDNENPGADEVSEPLRHPFVILYQRIGD